MATSPTSRPPEGVRARLNRLAERSVRGGLLSVADTAALAAAGFEPVSEVIGAVANAVTPGGFYANGGRHRSPAGPDRRQGPMVGSVSTMTYMSSEGSLAVGVPPTVQALKSGYRTMLARLTAEARAVGADGVIDIRYGRTVESGNGTELWRFLAVGTAIRSLGSTRTEQPFTTDLSGARVAAAVRSGWAPMSLIIAPCMAIRWMDYNTSRQRWVGSANVEVDAYTDVINTCRHQARTDFANAAGRLGADSAVLSDMTLDFDPGNCTATVIVTGTALARFDVPAAPPGSLTIMPLSTSR